ncbi:MAG: folate family ECF transporter S component [Bacillota bacterium]
MLNQHDHLRRLILAGFFASMAIVLKVLFSLTTWDFRITLYELPLILAGLTLGPALGLIAGFATDWIYVMLHPMAFSFNLFTVSAMLWGGAFGIFHFKKIPINLVTISVAIVSVSLVTFTLNTIQLYLFTGPGIFANVPFRLLITIIKWPIQIGSIYFIHQKVIASTDLIPSQEKRW